MGFKHNDKLYHVAQTFWAHEAENGWLFQFGAYGTTRVIVLAEPGTSSLYDALETAAEVVADVAPGVFHDEAVTEAYNEAIAEGMSPSEATEEAETDMTYTESGYIPSWEWTVSNLGPGDSLLDAAVAYAIEHEDDY